MASRISPNDGQRSIAQENVFALVVLFNPNREGWIQPGRPRADATSGGDASRKFALMMLYDAHALRNYDCRDRGRDRVVVGPALFDFRMQRAGIANAGGAAVTDEVEIKADRDIFLQPGLVEGNRSDHARSGTRATS